MPITANGTPRQSHGLREAAPAGPAFIAVRAALTRGVERMLVCDPEARQGAAEGVHGMRTSTRRLRSALRTFGVLVRAEWALPLAEELKWLAEVLGAVRDLDVLRERLLLASGRSLVVLAPLFRSLAVEHERASATLKAVLRSDRYQALLDDLEQAAAHPPIRVDLGKTKRSDLAQLVGKSWKTLKKRGRSLRPNDPDADFHEVRKRAKRARYAAEDLVGALGKRRAKGAKRFVRAVTKVQDILGEHQDAIVAAQTISRIVAGHPNDAPFKLAAHRLYKNQLRAADRSRERFFKAWNRLDRKSLRRWFRR